jgi:imidazolonepropionase-like amidohydrolase
MEAAVLLVRTRSERGMRADLIAVKGNPLKDVRVLEHVAFVMSDGEIVKNEITGWE